MNALRRRLYWVFAVVALAGAANACAAGQPPSQRPVVVRVDGGGFHWLDAGLGAIAAIAIVVLVLGVLAALRERRFAPSGERGEAG
jgi:hypothetical protein